MADDKEVLREVWEGKLPICFKLSQDECELIEPDEFYLMVPRHTYFPLIIDKVQRHFNDYIATNNTPNNNNKIWLDFNGTPLKM
jgi:autophagy-related protein 5